jgi:hypothetical protein
LPLGFSRNYRIRPEISVHINPKPSAAVLSTGNAATVKAAPLGRQHLHEAAAETGGEVVGEAEVAVERLTVELGEGVDLEDP